MAEVSLVLFSQDSAHIFEEFGGHLLALIRKVEKEMILIVVWSKKVDYCLNMSRILSRKTAYFN